MKSVHSIELKDQIGKIFVVVEGSRGQEGGGRELGIVEVAVVVVAADGELPGGACGGDACEVKGLPRDAELDSPPAVGELRRACWPRCLGR